MGQSYGVTESPVSIHRGEWDACACHAPKTASCCSPSPFFFLFFLPMSSSASATAFLRDLRSFWLALRVSLRMVSA